MKIAFQNFWFWRVYMTKGTIFADADLTANKPAHYRSIEPISIRSPSLNCPTIRDYRDILTCPICRLMIYTVSAPSNCVQDRCVRFFRIQTDCRRFRSAPYMPFYLQPANLPFNRRAVSALSLQKRCLDFYLQWRVCSFRLQSHVAPHCVQKRKIQSRYSCGFIATSHHNTSISHFISRDSNHTKPQIWPPLFRFYDGQLTGDHWWKKAPRPKPQSPVAIFYVQPRVCFFLFSCRVLILSAHDEIITEPIVPY